MGRSVVGKTGGGGMRWGEERGSLPDGCEGGPMFMW